MKVLVLCAEGSEEMETVITVDILRRAQIETVIANVNSSKDNEIECSRGVRIVANLDLEHAIKNSNSYHALVLPGGMGGAKTFASDKRVQNLIREFANSPRVVAAICAAPIALRAAEVFKDCKITSHPSVKDRLTDFYDYLDDRVVTVDGKLITSRGPGTAIDFALSLVSILKNHEVAKKVAEPMLIPDGTVIA